MKLLKKLLCAALAVSMLGGAYGMSCAATAESAKILYGDADGNGEVNLKDVIVMRKKYANWDVPKFNEKNADCNADGAFNAKDIILLRKSLAQWDVKLGPQGNEPTTTDDSSKYETANTYEIDKISDSMNTVGRSVLSAGSLKMEMSASGFEFVADFKGDMNLRFNWPSETDYSFKCVLGVMVDNDLDNMTRTEITFGRKTVKVLENVPAGVHTVRVVKLSEMEQGMVDVSSVKINGVMANKKPAEKDLKLEFYGDSITCGYGNLTPSGSGDVFGMNEHAYKTYASYAARELNAEFSVCSSSGYGWATDHSGDTNRVIGSIWDYAVYNKEKIKWDFSSYKADAVVVNLGTNDISYSQKSSFDSSKGGNDKVRAAVEQFISNIRSKNPDCKIIFVGGMMGKFKSSNLDLDSILNNIAANDSSIFYKGDFSTAQSGGQYHPSADEHKAAGKLVANYIKQCLNIK